MAGIYIHIPFCKKRCIYCDFFSSVSMGKKTDYTHTVCKELNLRKDYLSENVETVYFGGGTPSLLSAKDFDQVFDVIRSSYTLSTKPEITLEANPDDLSPEYLESIKHLPFNRLSLGIQSLIDEDLLFLNRRHNTTTAIKAVENAQKAGFKNISIDLIYGLPNQTLKSWEETLRQVLELNIQHISAYHLIYEEGTKLYQLLKTNKTQAIDEELSLRLFELLIDTLEGAGFEQYEISNFARPGLHSRHNSSYWEGKSYLGIGASAHSYNGTSRSWNKNRLDYLGAGQETEMIDFKTAYNEFILTRLRTRKGINPEELKALFGEEKVFRFLKKAEKQFQSELLESGDGNFRLTRKGLFVSDGIMSDLMD